MRSKFFGRIRSYNTVSYIRNGARKLLTIFLLICRTGFEMNVAVAILRLQEGLDYSGILGDIDDLIVNKTSGKRSTSRLTSCDYSINSDNSSQSPVPSTPLSISSTGKHYKHARTILDRMCLLPIHFSLFLYRSEL